MTEFNPEKYGFIPLAGTSDGQTSPTYIYEKSDFTLKFYIHSGFLVISCPHDGVLSAGQIPANNQSLALLLKAFAIKR